MSTDRELLELAARAAGVMIDYAGDNGGGRFNTGFDSAGNAVLDWHNGVRWNPLVDSGDAFTLAAELRMVVYFDSADVVTDERRTYKGSVIQPDERLAAVRRAIVEAAAEIGRAMP